MIDEPVNVADLIFELPERHDRLRVEYRAEADDTPAWWSVTSERWWDGSGDPDYDIGMGDSFHAAVEDWRRKIAPL